MMAENDWRKSFDARLAGRQKYRARIIVISENQSLPRRGPDKRQTESTPCFVFVNKYRATRKNYREHISENRSSLIENT